MSRCTPKSDAFISDIYNAIDKCFPYQISDIKVFYDAGEWSKRDYVAKFNVERKFWNKDVAYVIKYHMQNAGATNIIGGVRHAIAGDFVDFAFDIKKSKLNDN